MHPFCWEALDRHLHILIPYHILSIIYRHMKRRQKARRERQALKPTIHVSHFDYHEDLFNWCFKWARHSWVVKCNKLLTFTFYNYYTDYWLITFVIYWLFGVTQGKVTMTAADRDIKHGSRGIAQYIASQDLLTKFLMADHPAAVKGHKLTAFMHTEIGNSLSPEVFD